MGGARLFLHLGAVVRAVNHWFSRNPQWESYDECLSSRFPAFDFFLKNSLDSFYLCHFRNAFIKIIWSYFTQGFSCFLIGELCMLSSLSHCQKQNSSFEFYKHRTNHFDKEIPIKIKFICLTLT